MNFDTVEVVINKLIRTFRLREWEYDIEELVEDIAEALKHIGAAKMFEDKVAEITINQQIGRLPRDLQNIKHLLPINTPYKESGTFIEVDVPNGTIVRLVYQAMPLDQRGYILVPDNTAVREAVMWYLAKVLILQGVIKFPYQNAEQEWQWRCGSARADLNVMGIMQWSEVSNDFYRLNPIKDIHQKGYVEQGKPNTLQRDGARLDKSVEYSANPNTQQTPE